MMKQSLRFYFSLICIGVIAGLVGVMLTFLLHHIQHFAFGYGTNGVEMSFREGVQQSSYTQRIIALSICGVIVGLGWYLLQRYGAKLISVNKSLEKPQQGVPFFTTIAHALLQIVTVGFGSPLGREVAPREMSVAFASAWVRKIKLSDDDAKLLLACASGAGLTAVYNVPLAATIFILETMVLTFTKRSLASALICVVTATLVSRAFLGDLVQYAHLPTPPLNTSLFIFAILIGLIIGITANVFQFTAKKLPLLPRTSKRIVPFSIVAFLITGIISLYQPEILGNGKAGNQLTFGELITWNQSLQLFALKWVAVLLALAAGAYGGLITPSMMLGSTLAYALAVAWNFFFPSISLEAVAIVGACAFLGISLKMPLTSVAFLLELTRSSAEMLMPLSIAMAAAVIGDKCYQKWKKG